MSATTDGPAVSWSSRPRPRRRQRRSVASAVRAGPRRPARRARARRPPRRRRALGTPAPGPVTPKTEAPNEARVLSSAFSAVARALRPSVVRIDVEIKAHACRRQRRRRATTIWRRFCGASSSRTPPERAPGPQRGTGSGHRPRRARRHRHQPPRRDERDHASSVTFNDGREFSAKTLGMDAETDVAVIRLDKPPARSGRGAARRLGHARGGRVGARGRQPPRASIRPSPPAS